MSPSASSIEEGLKVDAVGERVGYRDLSTFRRLFKRRSGAVAARIPAPVCAGRPGRGGAASP